MLRSTSPVFLIPHNFYSYRLKYNFNFLHYSKNYSIYFYFINFLSFIYIYINYFFNNNYSPIYYKITNLKKLIVYSSINQIGWILFIIIISSKIWLTYLSIYLISIIIFTFIITYNLSLNFSSWINLTSSTKLILLFIIILIYSNMNVQENTKRKYEKKMENDNSFFNFFQISLTFISMIFYYDKCNNSNILDVNIIFENTFQL